MTVEQDKSQRIGEMFERNSGFIETMSRWFTRDPQDAEDVMQNVAESLLRGEEYKGFSSEETFLFAVVLNEARKFHRAAAAGKRGGGQVAQSLESLPPESLGISPSAETVAVLSETIREVSKEPCMALRLEGYHILEIAVMTGIRVPAVKSRIHRCRVENPGSR